MDFGGRRRSAKNMKTRGGLIRDGPAISPSRVLLRLKRKRRGLSFSLAASWSDGFEGDSSSQGPCLRPNRDQLGEVRWFSLSICFLFFLGNRWSLIRFLGYFLLIASLIYNHFLFSFFPFYVSSYTVKSSSGLSEYQVLDWFWWIGGEVIEEWKNLFVLFVCFFRFSCTDPFSGIFLIL